MSMFWHESNELILTSGAEGKSLGHLDLESAAKGLDAHLESINSQPLHQKSEKHIILKRKRFRSRSPLRLSFLNTKLFEP
jgi:hypothetical protein